DGGWRDRTHRTLRPLHGPKSDQTAFAPANAVSLGGNGWKETMALKVELKPNERILIGESVVTNCNQRSSLVIEGASPVLREKDILTAQRADTPAKRIYLAVQLMYTSRDPRAHHEVY